MKFMKYSATGNDFIVIDNREGSIDVKDRVYWETLCRRRTGIGADGVLFLESSESHDFHMRYLNADGLEVSMCGNGARALSHYYANLLNKTTGLFSFSTSNGKYESVVNDNYAWVKMVEKYDLGLVDVDAFFDSHKGSVYLNTGVPHAVYFVDEVKAIDVVKIGRDIRNRQEFKEGVNVNFFAKSGNFYDIRTYERGVEDETLSCGTGITACAHYLWDNNLENSKEIIFHAQAGELKVKKDGDSVFFGGKVQKIYKGEA